jgi:hypothetical protein
VRKKEVETSALQRRYNELVGYVHAGIARYAVSIAVASKRHEHSQSFDIIPENEVQTVF